MRAVTVLAVVVGFAAFGCTTGGGGGSASITGAVTVSGKPAPAGTTVVLAGPTGQTAQLDASGKYSFTKLHDGAYAVIAEVASTQERRLVGNVSVAPAGSGTADLAFTGVGSLAGVATLPGAASSAGIAVSVDGTSAVAVTDAAGKYAIAGVPVGAHTVTAAVPGQGSASAKVDVAYAKETAVPALTVGKGTGSIAGAVTLAGATDKSGVVIELVGPTTAITTTDASGAFAFGGLADGTYVLTAHGVDLSPLSRSLQVKLTGGAAVSGLTLDFAVTGSLSGKVTLNGAPVANASVLVAGSAVAASTQADGSYSLPGVPVGQDTVTVLGAGIAPQSQQVSVTRGQTATLSFAVQPAQGLATVAGSTFLPDGTPAAAAHVQLSTGEQTTTDADGGFQLKDVVSGLESISIVGADPAFQETVPSVFATAGSNGFYFGNGRVEALAPIELAHGPRVASANCAALATTAPDRSEATLFLSSSPYCNSRALLAGQSTTGSPIAGSGLIRVRPDGTAQALPLPPTGTVDDVSYGDDAKTLVYRFHDATAGGTHFVTTLVWLDGSHAPLQLDDSTDGRPTTQYLPGGAQLLLFQVSPTATTSGTMTLSVVNTATATITKLDDGAATLPGSAVYVVQGGTHLYWLHADAAGTALYAGLVDGSMVHQLATLTQSLASGAVMLHVPPAGDVVVVRDGSALTAYGFAVATPAPIAAGVSQELTMASGSTFLVVRSTSSTTAPTVVERFTVSVAQGAAAVSAATPILSVPTGNFLDESFSTDNALVLCRSSGAAGSLLMVAAETGTPTQLTTAPVLGDGFVGTTHTAWEVEANTLKLSAIASDGSISSTKAVATTSSSIQSAGHLLVYVDSAGSSILTDDQLTAPFTVPLKPAYFYFSPDGTHVAITSGGTGTALLATPPAVPVDTQLSVNDVFWSNDGARLVLTEATPNQFTVADAAFRQPVQLTGVTCMNRFSPSGLALSFRQLEPSGKYRLSIFDVAHGKALAVLSHNPEGCFGQDLTEWLAGDKLVSWRANDLASPYQFQAGPYVLSGP